MNKRKPSDKVSTEELTKLLALKKRQLAFDKYPKAVQEIMTRMGINPYEKKSVDERQYREFTVTIKEK